MCEYFVKADPILYEQRTRSIRIRGMLTSIRLENTVWDVLAEMAEDEGCTTNALICTLHDEILDHRGEVSNFASFLRVTSLRYLQALPHLARKAAPGGRCQLEPRLASSAHRHTPRPSGSPRSPDRR
jgi:predicted DNA-binding ribbon-helix-helix protein